MIDRLFCLARLLTVQPLYTRENHVIRAKGHIGGSRVGTGQVGWRVGQEASGDRWPSEGRSLTLPPSFEAWLVGQCREARRRERTRASTESEGEGGWVREARRGHARKEPVRGHTHARATLASSGPADDGQHAAGGALGGARQRDEKPPGLRRTSEENPTAPAGNRPKRGEEENEGKAKE